jgi:hypothetical protein
LIRGISIIKTRSLVHPAALLVFFFALTQLVFADVTISGTQTRGRGTNGKLNCEGESLQNGGFIIRAEDAGAGFWLQSDKGHLLRFNKAIVPVTVNTVARGRVTGKIHKFELTKQDRVWRISDCLGHGNSGGYSAYTYLKDALKKKKLL